MNQKRPPFSTPQTTSGNSLNLGSPVSGPVRHVHRFLRGKEGRSRGCSAAGTGALLNSDNEIECESEEVEEQCVGRGFLREFNVVR